MLRAHGLDPVPDAWMRLMLRVPHNSWDDLKDAALLAMEYREAAEILLLFYEDLADRGQAEPLPVNGWDVLAPAPRAPRLPAPYP